MYVTEVKNSSQNSVLMGLNETYTSWAHIILKNISGEEVSDIISKKSFQSIVISSSKFIKNTDYIFSTLMELR